MTNHHDEMRVAPDPSRAEELRQRLHARLSQRRTGDLGRPRRIPPVDTDTRPSRRRHHHAGDRRPPPGPRTGDPRRRSPGRWLLVAAAAAVVAVVGTLLVAAGGDDEDPVDTAPPTAHAAPAQDVMEVEGASQGFPALEPGRYFVDPDGDDTTPLRVSYEVAAEGWSAWFGAVKFTDPGVTMLSITTVPNLVTDACLDHTPPSHPWALPSTTSRPR